MENFKALVMKIASSDPTRPLTPARKALIEKRIPEFFPDFHTPNHPTYAAMIHRAIVELKEQEGSSEESISEFIKKEYDDLPWAHLTLLKHHLQKLCGSGDIVVTSDRCYLLDNGVTNLKSAPCPSPTREPMQQTRKRQGEKSRVRGRWHRKDQIKEQNQPEGDQMEMIRRQNQVQEQHNLVTEEHNLAEPQNECIEELNVLQALLQKQRSGLIGEENQLEGQITDSEHVEQKQPDVSSPESPPGFNLMTVKELSKLQEQQLPEGSPDFCCLQKNPKPQLETMTTSIDFPINVKQPQMQQQHDRSYPEGILGTMTTFLPPPTSVTSLDISTDSQLLEQEQQPEFSNSEGPLEPEGRQKATKALPITSATSLTLPMNSEPPEQCKLELPNSGRFSEVKRTTEGEVGEMQHQQGKQHSKKRKAISGLEAIITQDVPMNSNHQLGFPNTGKCPGPKLAIVLPLSEEQQQQQAKLCEGQKVSESEPATATASLNLPKLSEQQPDSSVPERPMELDLEAMEKSSQTEWLQQQARQRGRRKRIRSKSKTMTTQVLPTNSVQLSELPNPEQCQRPEIVKVEPFSKEEEHQAMLFEGRKATESLLEAMTAALDLPNDSEGAQKQQHLQTQEKQQQRQLWPRPPKFEEAVGTTSVELLPLPCQPQELLQRPNMGTLQEVKQTPVEESTRQEGQRPKLRGCRKQLTAQAKTKIDSLDSPLASQENPQHRQLQPRLSKSEAVAATTTAELVPVQHQHEELQQIECQDQGRPLKRKYDTTPTVGELSPSDHQDLYEQKQPAPLGLGRPRKYPHIPQQQQLPEQTKCRGQGRPPKPKPDDATMENVLPSEKQQQEPKRQGRGRPRKVDEGK